jgi:Rieske Fe-S protein
MAWHRGDDEVTALDRRTVLRAACAGCAAIGLAACGGGSSKASSPEPTSDAPSAAGNGTSPAGSKKVIAKLADIPVGGSASAKSPAGKPLLLARPTATTVVAFSAICTHQGCTVEPAGNHFGCPCHDSVYDAFTGKNISGPAPRPLSPFAVAISGEDVVAA